MKKDDRRPWCLPEGYEKLEPPVKDNETIDLDFTFAIEDIRNIDDEQETIQIEMYLERQWMDERINVNTENPLWPRSGELPLNLGILDHLWKPFITIRNLVDFKKHSVIEDLAGLKINKNKTISHSIQALITIACPRDFQKYPFDHHVCHFMAGSYSHSIDRLQCSSRFYSEIQKRKLQYRVEFTDLPANKSVVQSLSDPEVKFSNCGFEVKLERKVVTLLYQVYIPLYLFVVCSWVSFLIPPDIVPGRFGGLIVLFLIAVNMFNSTKDRTNMTTGLNNLDIFSISCIFMIFFAILEYTWILIVMAKLNFNQQYEYKKEDMLSDDVSIAILETTIEDVTEDKKKIKTVSRFWKKFCFCLSKPRLLDAISIVLFPVGFFSFSLYYWLVLCAGPEHFWT